MYNVWFNLWSFFTVVVVNCVNPVNWSNCVNVCQWFPPYLEDYKVFKEEWVLEK